MHILQINYSTYLYDNHFQIHYRATSIFFLNFDTIIFQSILQQIESPPLFALFITP